jgi:hypothetical protein
MIVFDQITGPANLSQFLMIVNSHSFSGWGRVVEIVAANALWNHSDPQLSKAWT